MNARNRWPDPRDGYVTAESVWRGHPARVTACIWKIEVSIGSQSIHPSLP